MEIDENILKTTTKCIDNYECLKNENHPCLKSKVESYSIGKVIFINCIKTDCHYKMDYGYSTICNCPVRIEIFNKYDR